ncbi:hypothetical protein [Chitinophaga agri]|uniref:Uncharacterized protein n=1 Tax=Chitinophaga agri TaxID=2703787 RepID=A0A6B9ZNK8_9BACT|nr:hypothetical protein [Chitinophaga agri]QHS63469.1 hypothetical protein GWR21_28955 [Chitinophaga agri]
MAAVAILLGYLIPITYILVMLLSLYCVVRMRKRLAIAIPAALFFIFLLITAVLFIKTGIKQQDKDLQALLGYYTLTSLDGQDCPNCLVRLNDNYEYDILKDDQVIGHGKWWMESAVDLPGKYLKIENGPAGVIWPQIRTIDYINR